MTTKCKNDMLKNTGYRSLIAALALAASTTWLHAGVHRFDVTINYAGESATNVPTLLRLSESTIADFHYADTANGKDFEIYDDTGALLPYEIDTWNPEGESLLWVKVPVFENGKKLSVTYGRTRRDMTVNATNVWSGYVGVWHMNETNAEGKFPNATGASMFDGVVSSFSATDQTGKFGNSVLIYTNASHTGKNGAIGTERYEFEKGGVFIPDNGNMNLTDNFVMSGWFKHSTVYKKHSSASGNTSYAFRYDYIFAKRGHSEPDHKYNIGEDPTIGFGIRISDNADQVSTIGFWGSQSAQPTNSPFYISSDYSATKTYAEFRPADITSPKLSNGSWRHLSFAVSYVMTNDTTAAHNPYTTCIMQKRVDGTSYHVGDVGLITDNDKPFVIGNTTAAFADGSGDEYGDRAWGGCADEVRLIIGAPSAAYLAAEYAGMAQADLLTFGEVREFNDRFMVTINYAGESATNVPMRLRLSTALIDGFSYADTANGTNFEIYDDRGALLPYEIDTWNPEGESLLWVKVPVFEGGKKLSVTYGRTTMDMTVNATNVWSEYVGVWHMNELTPEGKYPNATGASIFDGVVSSFSATGQGGKFGNSVLIYTNASHTGKGGAIGTEFYEYEKGGVFIPDDGNMNLTTNFVMSGWFKHSTVYKKHSSASGNTSYAFRYDNIFYKRGHSETNHPYNAGMDYTSGFGIRIANGGATVNKIGVWGPYVRVPSTSPYYLASDYQTSSGTYVEFRPEDISPVLSNSSGWRHFSFAISYVETNDTTKAHNPYSTCIYQRRIDGTTYKVGDVGIIKDNDLPFVIGNTTAAYRDGIGDEYGDRAWGGCADEVRLIIGAPSAAWLDAEYAGMADDGLLTYGPATNLDGVMILFF